MAEASKIQWTGATWNPIVGCSIHSPGCRDCYAMGEAWRKMHHPHPAIAEKFAGTARLVKGKAVWTGRVNLHEPALLMPLKRKSPQTYFVNSLSDLFHKAVPFSTVDRVFATMALCPQHIFQILTKRADRQREYMDAFARGGRHVTDELDRLHAAGTISAEAYRAAIRRIRGTPSEAVPLPNVWLGVSVEDRKRAKERIPQLMATPAAVRFLSCEPLLELVDLTPWLDPTGACCGGDTRCADCPADAEWRFTGPCTKYDMAEPQLHWVICGGESGPTARPMHPDWARALRDQCAEAGVPFFFKQWGAYAPMGPPNAISASSDTAWPDGTVGGGESAARGGLGTTLVHLTNSAFGKKCKREIGRLLDGVEHNGTPELPA